MSDAPTTATAYTPPLPSNLPAAVLENLVTHARGFIERAVRTWWSYREVEPGIWELLDARGQVVAWVGREGIRQIEAAHGELPNALPWLFGPGARVRILPNRLAVEKREIPGGSNSG